MRPCSEPKILRASSTATEAIETELEPISFRTDVLGRRKGTLQQMFQLPGDGSRCARDGEGLFHLAKNLRLANNHGVETCGDAEEMPDRVLVALLIDVRREQSAIEPKMPMQKLRSGRFADHRRRRAVPRGCRWRRSCTPSRRAARQSAGGLRQIVARDGDPFAQLDGRGLVVDSNQGQCHGAPNLWT